MARKIIIIAILVALGGLMIAYWATVPKAQGALEWTRVGNLMGNTIHGFAELNGKLYAIDAGIERYNGGTSWTLIWPEGASESSSSIVSFGNKLYVGTYNGGSGAQVWESADGTNWHQINVGGFGAGSTATTCTSLVGYNDKLYATVSMNGQAGRVYRYEGGTNWTDVSPPWDYDNEPLSAISYDGRLWVGTENTSTGTEIWRYDGTTWQQVNQDGFGSYKLRATFALTIYDNKLYAGGSGLTDAKVLRYNSGTDWTCVDTGSFASNPGSVLSMISYNGKLFTGGTYGEEYPGTAQVWSYNGSSWSKENENGFGDPQTSEARAMAVFNNELYVGTVGATAQVWRTTEAPPPPEPAPVICERAMYGNGRTWAHDSVGVTQTANTWYLAEGCTQGGMETFILVQNPGSSPVTVDLILQTSSGEQRPALLQDQVIPAGFRRTFNLNPYVTDWDVSTKVEATGPVICERAMYGNGRTWAHDSVGVTQTANTWYLAEGCTQGGMETFILVQNPGSSPVTVDLILQTSSGEQRPALLQDQVIPAGFRRTFNLNPYVTDWDVSTKVEAYRAP